MVLALDLTEWASVAYTGAECGDSDDIVYERNVVVMREEQSPVIWD
jgi:hypothetical protein